MTYAAIIAHLELGRTNTGVLQASRALADQFGASVIGVAAGQPMPLDYADGFAYGNLVEQDQAQIAHEVREAEAEFRVAFKQRNWPLEWRAAVLVTSLSDYLAREARSADVVVTAAAVGNATNGTSRVSVGSLVMQTGRPVLVVPQTPQDLQLNQVLVAWRDTREARRAVADALPLLQKAMHVSLVEIADEANLQAACARVGDVAAWLGRHGIAAEPQVLPSDGNDAAQLDAVANKQGADVIVAGAYGHSRLREWALGGMTRTLIQNDSRCSFLSH